MIEHIYVVTVIVQSEDLPVPRVLDLDLVEQRTIQHLRADRLENRQVALRSEDVGARRLVRIHITRVASVVCETLSDVNLKISRLETSESIRPTLHLDQYSY
jgi:hypothetical protein